MTTVERLKPSRVRRDCSRCKGEARYRLITDDKKDKTVLCVWCVRPYGRPL